MLGRVEDCAVFVCCFLMLRRATSATLLPYTALFRSRRLVLATLLSSVLLYLALNVAFPDMNYFVRSSWVIVVTFAAVAIPTIVRNGWRLEQALLVVSNRSVARFGTALAVSLVVVHVVFH